ncbi:MAG: DUF2306 domain-containing protein [Microscillaceae bacterium]|nr:DUF2306 domain-containing protein [Microscillaceae bacterium]
MTKSLSIFLLKSPQRLFWLFLTLLSLLLVYVTLPYFSFRTDINFLLAKRAFIQDRAWMAAFYIHVSSSIVCLITGPWQFVPALRRGKWRKWHRIAGQAYVLSILLFAAPSGFYMALFANGGWGAQLGFGILSVLWIFTTYQAYACIVRGNVAAHRTWMVRSYALTFSAVTLRLWVPVLSLYFEVDHQTTVVATAWLNWIPNLLAGELLRIFYTKSL